MRLSTRSRYGTRLMLELASHYDKKSIFLKNIAQKENISEKYLSHLVIPLKASGLVNSSRGAHGGYRLAKPPSLITVKDIVKALEGDVSPVECVKNPAVCERFSTCAARDVWDILDRKISETLDSITLQDLIRLQEKKVRMKT